MIQLERIFEFNVVFGDAVHCLSRALVLGIVVSSEALLARQKRIGFERHLILFGGFTLLMLAELLGTLLSVGAAAGLAWTSMAWWVWYPVLGAVGLLAIALCFDYVRATARTPAGENNKGSLKRHSRQFLVAAGILLACAAYLAWQTFSDEGPPTSFNQIKKAAYLLHGLQAAAMLVVAWKALVTYGLWLSRTETRILLVCCFIGMMGALAQIYHGPGEVLTTISYTFMAAIFLRDNYRRSEIEAVRASEDRTARMLLFHRITTQLKSSADLPRLCEITMDSLLGNLGAESGAIYLKNQSDGTLKPALLYGPYPPPMPIHGAAGESDLRTLIEQTPVAEGLGVIGRVAASGVPIFIYDVRDAAEVYRWPTGETSVHTSIALPLRSPEGVIGVVQVVNRLDGEPFTEENLRFMSLIVEQAGLSIYNARLQTNLLQQQRAEEQLRVAREIQLRLIPEELPKIPGLTLAAEYRAAQEVGGDYFDFYQIDHDHLGMVVLDVAGKGVPGALLMAITGTFLKMASARSNSPAWVLNEINAALSAEMRKGLYITAIYGVLRLSTLQLTMVNAGHPDALIIRDRDLNCEKHKPRGAAIGLLRPNRFRAIMEQETVQLEEGDTLLLYTDGIIEAMNEAGVQFGEERLCDVARHFSRSGAKTLTREIVRAVETHAGAGPQYDDMTVVALRIAPDPSEPAPEDA